SRRPDPYVSSGAPRELMVRFWYPAANGANCRPAEYTSPQVWSYFSTLLGVSLPHVLTNSCLDAPVAHGLHPVVVFSPGFTAPCTDQTSRPEHLASRGYLVAAINHTYDATAVEFPDGRLEKSIFGSHLTSYSHSDAQTLAFAASVRLADIRLVLNTLHRLTAERGGTFADKLDLSRIALAGHSLGGLTTILGMQSDPRFTTAVILDALVPEHLSPPMKTPLLILAAGHEQWNEDDCRLWATLRGPRAAVNFPGAEPIAFSDAVWLLKDLVRTGDLDPDQTIAAIRELVASFLDSNLRGQESKEHTVISALSRSAANYPGLMVATQAQSLCGLR